MNMVEKLSLQKQLSSLVLFKEGVFLRAYNESSYILTQLLQQDLKIQYYPVKQNYNKWVSMCAFPYNKLAIRLHDAELTEFGAQLKGEFDLSGYRKWFAAGCRQAREADLATATRKKGAQAPFTRPAEPSIQNDDDLTNITITLTTVQFTHLLHWQPGYYPQIVEDKFMEYLKAQAITICAANMIKENEG